MRARLLGITLLITLAGCERSEGRSDLEKLCSDDGYAALFRTGGDPRETLIQARRIHSSVRDPEVLRLVAAVLESAPDEKVALLEAAVAKAKLARCPLLDSVRPR